MKRYILTRSVLFVILWLSTPLIFAHGDVEPTDNAEAISWIKKALHDFTDVKITDNFVVYRANGIYYSIALPRIFNVTFNEQKRDIRPYCVAWYDYVLDGPSNICWGYKGHKESERFASALQYLSNEARHKTQAEADADWAHFQEQLIPWRQANPKPPMPGAAQEHQILAEYAFKEKNTEKAMLEYNKALNIFSTWPDGQFNLATLCGEEKHYQCAILHMKEYLELSPDSPDAQVAKDSMIIWKDKLSDFEAATADMHAAQTVSGRN